MFAPWEAKHHRYVEEFAGLSEDAADNAVLQVEVDTWGEAGDETNSLVYRLHYTILIDPGFLEIWTSLVVLRCLSFC